MEVIEINAESGCAIDIAISRFINEAKVQSNYYNKDITYFMMFNDYKFEITSASLKNFKTQKDEDELKYYLIGEYNKYMSSGSSQIVFDFFINETVQYKIYFIDEIEPFGRFGYSNICCEENEIINTYKGIIYKTTNEKVKFDLNNKDFFDRSKELVTLLNNQFTAWCKRKKYTPLYKSLPKDLVHYLLENNITYVEIQNAHPKTILNWYLEYNGIFGYTESIYDIIKVSENGQTLVQNNS